MSSVIWRHRDGHRAEIVNERRINCPLVEPLKSEIREQEATTQNERDLASSGLLVRRRHRRGLFPGSSPTGF
jgi:hypothetical protein